MKRSKFKEGYRESASSYHKKIGDVLRSSKLFNGYRIHQEWPVSDIDSTYVTNAHHFDWVILDLKLVIEVHGEQHYQPCTFGGISMYQAISNHLSQKHRDNMKMNAAIRAGYTYLAIPFSEVENATDEYIWNLYLKLENKNKAPKTTPPKKQPNQVQLDKARAARASSYQKAKEHMREFKAKRNEL